MGQDVTVAVVFIVWLAGALVTLGLWAFTTFRTRGSAALWASALLMSVIWPLVLIGGAVALIGGAAALLLGAIADRLRRHSS